MGHMLEMAQGSGVRMQLDVEKIDLLGEAVELARMGLLPEGMYRNRAFAEAWVDTGDTPLWVQDVLYDPQTSGGLLMAVDREDADALLQALEGQVPSAQRIGAAEPWESGARILLR